MLPDDLTVLAFKAEPIPECPNFIHVIVGDRRRRPNAQFSPSDSVDRRHFVGVAPFLFPRVGIEALDGFMLRIVIQLRVAWRKRELLSLEGWV